jgi:HD-like signal output (HDOD) protein/DNA-binding NarL/FixJ family response regulator
MSMILVVDDMAIFRDPIAASLRLAGYETRCAANAKDALTMAMARAPDLVLLDLNMPEIGGLTVLRAMRSDTRLKEVPVMLLTAVTDKKPLMEAVKLGVRECLLKSRFSLEDLLERVARLVGGGGPPDKTPAAAPPTDQGNTPPSPPLGEAPPAAGQAAAAAVSTDGGAAGKVSMKGPPRLMDRDECIRRTEKAMQGKTLSGVVAQVIAMATSPRTDTVQLASVISRDSILSARILQAANSAAYASNKGVVMTIPDAIRNVGCTTVRNIAAALGIFDVMPQTAPDGFNPIRCWQHSFAVAQLCEKLSASMNHSATGAAYLVGLCHDLGDMLFHSHFGAEYQQVLEAAPRSELGLEDLERQMLGMTRRELVLTVLQHVGLPDIIRVPVESLHGAAGWNDIHDPMARMLALADLYANGLLLASSASSPIAPLTQMMCKAAAANPNPECPDGAALQSEVFSLTALLARLSTQEEKELMQPLVGRSKLGVYLAREKNFSSFDPVFAALNSMAQAQVHEALPTQEQFRECDALVVLARTPASSGLSGPEIAQCLRRLNKLDFPLLWLSERSNDPVTGDLRPTPFPLPLSALLEFVHSAAKQASSSRAA